MNDDVMISLLAPAGLPARELDTWVEEQVDGLRTRWRLSGVGIGELTRSCPSEGGHWLIELDLSARSGPLERDVELAGIVTDLERLRLRPEVFVRTAAAVEAQ